MNRFKTTLPLTVLSLLMVLMGYALGSRPGMVIAFAIMAPVAALMIQMAVSRSR